MKRKNIYRGLLDIVEKAHTMPLNNSLYPVIIYNVEMLMSDSPHKVERFNANCLTKIRSKCYLIEIQEFLKRTPTGEICPYKITLTAYYKGKLSVSAVFEDKNNE
jgi:hypothetical protein